MPCWSLGRMSTSSKGSWKWLSITRNRTGTVFASSSSVLSSLCRTPLMIGDHSGLRFYRVHRLGSITSVLVDMWGLRYMRLSHLEHFTLDYRRDQSCGLIVKNIHKFDGMEFEALCLHFRMAVHLHSIGSGKST